MIIDTFSLVTLCAALVLVTAWGLVGWRYVRRSQAQTEKALDVADQFKALCQQRDADAVRDYNAQANLTHAARTAANAWRDVALDSERRSVANIQSLPPWPELKKHWPTA